MHRLMGGLGVLALSALTLFTPPADAAGGRNVHDCDGTLHGTVHNVTVQAGSTCIIGPDVTVTGGVHAKSGAANLIVQTNVARNIMAKGVTGLVQIGPAGCKFDPLVGNNVRVFDSHNVLLCKVTTKNNIGITRDNGRISVLDSHAGRNLNVSRLRAYVADPNPGTHRHPEWVRVFRSTAGNHIFERGDLLRIVVNRDDFPSPIR